MKLVMLTSNYPYGQFGDNCFVQNEIRALAERFDDITVISTGTGAIRDDVPDNVKVIGVFSRKIRWTKLCVAALSLFGKRVRDAMRELKLLYPRVLIRRKYMSVAKYEYVYWQSAKIICQECADADLVYSYWASTKAYCVARLKENGKIHCPFVSRAHGFDLYLRPDACAPYRKAIGNQLDALILISHGGETYYRNTIYPLLEHPCELKVFYLGIDADAVCNPYSGSETLRIVSCSNMVAIKRLDRMIDALARIDDVQIEWKHFGDGDCRAQLEQQAKEQLDSHANIRYEFVGAVENRVWMRYLQEHETDLFVNCSDSEGVPVSMMEAACFGIPVLCRDVGGTAEINCGNNEGLLLDCDADAQAFATAIRNFAATDLQTILCRREEMRQIFTEKFSRAAIEKFADYLAEIAGRCLPQFDKRVLHICSNYVTTKIFPNLLKECNAAFGGHDLFCPVSKRRSSDNRTYLDDKDPIFTENARHARVSACYRELDRYLFFPKRRKVVRAIERQYGMSRYGALMAHSLFTDGWAAYRLHRKYAIPYTVFVQNSDINHFFPKYKFLRRAAIRILQHARAIIFCSQKVKERAYAQYVPRKIREDLELKTHIIPFGIEPIFFENQPAAPREAQTRRARVVTVGTIEANKNQLTVAKALEILRADGWEISYQFAGKIADEAYFRQLKAYDFAEYCGCKTYEELIPLYRESDVFVLPSVHETFGLVYAEALSQGLPIIYSAGQGFDGQFPQGEVGYAVDSNNPQEIAEKIRAILRDCPQFSQNAVNGGGRFRWNIVAQAYQNAIQGV